MVLSLPFTPIALSFLPLLVRCAPWDACAEFRPRQYDLAVTETLISTYIATSAVTTVTTVTSTFAPVTPPASSGTVPTSGVASPSSAATSGPEAILILPGSVGALSIVVPVPPPSAAPSSQSPATPSSQSPATPSSQLSAAPSSQSSAAPSSQSSVAPSSSQSPVAPSSQSSVASSLSPSPTDAAGPASAPLLMAYYPDWAGSAFPPEKIDFGRFDWIDFAFAVPDENFNLTWDSPPDATELLARLITAAHRSGKKVKLSVGGWTGSKYFSAAAADPQSRQTLATNILALYQQYSLDGIDIDWEYPGQGGNDGNTVDPNDTANFLAFLQLLRTVLPPESKITAAVQTVPFADDQGLPMQDVSQFAAVLDWVLLMNYDTWGSSKTPGPNAPLSDACGNSTQGSASAAAALAAWTAAGFPPSQLVLGVPSYGYLSRSSATALSTRAHARRSKHLRRQGLLNWADSLVSGLAAEASGAAVLATNDDGGADNGQIQFRALVQQGVLQLAPDNTTDTGTGPPTRAVVAGRELHSLYEGGGGFARLWDNCSSTPFLRSGAAGQVIAYDDPLSLGLKAAFVAQAGMRGVNMFDVHGDTDSWHLADALRIGLGLT